MLSPEGCRQRRRRLWQALDPQPGMDHLRLADPIHLAYLAGFYVDPFSLSGGFSGYLLLRRDGQAKLLHDNRIANEAVADCQVEQREEVPWYDAQSPSNGPRQLVLLQGVNPTHAGLRFHDRPGDPLAAQVITTLANLRRRKDTDEIALFRRTVSACEAGHRWARENIKPGMTEIDVYLGVSGACIQTAGQHVVVYGDFAVSPGPERRGGPPTRRVLEPGDLFILDYSVVLGGYRCDFTNTLSIGRQPTADQQRLFDLCLEAMAAGEKELFPGRPCRTVYEAVNAIFDREGLAEFFPHHAGHGLGLTHPEAPFIVRHADESLEEGDIITLEPGLYVQGIGGMRIEHNYLITDKGYERLSNHAITLV